MGQQFMFTILILEENSMKTVVLGDIHGRSCWKDIVKIEKPQRVVFLGDYVSSHENVSAEQQILNLKDILTFKEESEANGLEVILLRGNHDIQHLDRDTCVCSYFADVANWMNENRERFLKDTQWVYEDGDIVFSHAGISECWFKDFRFHSISEINNCEGFNAFRFRPAYSFDTYGDSKTQGPTWIRPQTLLKCAIPNKKYVIGHTGLTIGLIDLAEYARQKGVEDVVEGIEIWCCDTLPKQYLVIEDNGKFNVKNI